MFFIGISNHLIPLLLSISLPILFFMPGKNIDSNKETIDIYFHYNSADFPQYSFTTYEVESLFLNEVEDIAEAETTKQLTNRTTYTPLVKELFYLPTSGNKAPPVS